MSVSPKWWPQHTDNDFDSDPDNKVHGASMGPTWVLSAPDGPHVGPTNLAIRGSMPSLHEVNPETYAYWLSLDTFCIVWWHKFYPYNSGLLGYGLSSITVPSQLASWCLKSQTTPLLVQLHLRMNIKENIKTPRHKQLHCWFNCLFGWTPKKTSKLRVTVRLWGNPGTGGIRSQRACNAKNVFMSWRHVRYMIPVKQLI